MEITGSALSAFAIIEFGVVVASLMCTVHSDKIMKIFNPLVERNHKLEIGKRRQMQELANEKFK